MGPICRAERKVWMRGRVAWVRERWMASWSRMAHRRFEPEKGRALVGGVAWL
jgi:hypothetical protein